MRNHFLISRTDSIGDVILTLPMVGLLKQAYPGCKISFLGTAYTRPVTQCCRHIDAHYDWNAVAALEEAKQIDLFRSWQVDCIVHVFPNRKVAAVAKKAGIRERIGTTNRLYHWTTCNRLVRLSRKKSPLHEAQLNAKLLQPLGIHSNDAAETLWTYYGMQAPSVLLEDLKNRLSPDRFNLILHPKSKGSAREWTLDHYAGLIRRLSETGRFAIFLTGTEAEGQLFRKELVRPFPFVTDLSGQLSLEELIAFIASADGLLACSTGPLHIAAALSTWAVGIYPPIRPMHPGRWAPLGKHTKVFVREQGCEDCRNTNSCACIQSITAEEVSDFFIRLAASPNPVASPVEQK